MTSGFADIHLTGDSQCFPFYTYDEDGSNRRENITDWALSAFRSHYGDPSICKWDIFHYVYGLLHHPDYRSRYEKNLKRDLPHIPFAPEFRAFASAGEELADLHVNYESAEPYALKMVEAEGKPLNWLVEKMRFSKDKTAIVYNDFLTLSGIPPAALEYRLGNRSALEWVVNQYQVKTDKRSGIVNDPNRADDPQYIVNLIKRVVSVSLRTVEIVKALPAAGHTNGALVSRGGGRPPCRAGTPYPFLLDHTAYATHGKWSRPALQPGLRLIYAPLKGVMQPC